MKITMKNFYKAFKAIFDNDYFFSIIAKFAGVFFALIYSAFYNRYLGTALKGEAAIISNYSSLISALLCFGIYQAYPFYRRKNRGEFYNFFNNITSLYSIIFAFFLLLGIVLHNAQNLSIAFGMSPILSYIRHINYMVTIEKPKTRNISSIIINLFDLFLIVVFYFFTEASYNNLILILLLQLVFNLGISFSNLRIKRKACSFTLRRIPIYVKFGFIPMITLFLMTINYRIDILMLEKTPSISLSQIGIYSVGVALAEKVWLIPDAIKDILLSKLCNGKSEQEVSRVIRLNLVISLFVIIFVAIISKYFVLLVYGDEYQGADLITVIILVGTIGMIFYKMVYSYNISLGKRFANLLFLGAAALANIIGNIFLIPMWGIYGAALTSVVSYSVCGFLFLFHFHYTSKISFFKILFVQKEDILMIKQFFKKI